MKIESLSIVIIVAATLSFEAWGQANSDFYAYPDNYRAVTDQFRDDRQLTFNRLPGLSLDYEIDAGDLLEIKVLGSEELSQSLRVSNSGNITLPLLGLIPAAGRTAAMLESEIAGLLKDRGLFVNPEVLVWITEYKAKPIYLLGQVDRPGEYVMSQQWTIMDALFVAGGLDFGAAQYGYVHRRLTSDSSEFIGKPNLQNPAMAQPGTEVIRIDLQPFKEGKVIDPNIRLKKGDVIVVPTRSIELFYVIGDVTRAGGYEMPPDKNVTVSRALSWAGGPTKEAKMSDGILVRFDESGQRKEIPMDFAAIIGGEKSDFEVKANDILFVPGSKAKTIGYGLLGVIPSIVRNYAVFALFP